MTDRDRVTDQGSVHEETLLSASAPAGALATPAVDEARDSYPTRTSVFGRLLRNPIGLVCLLFLLAVVVFGIMGPFIITNSPTAVRLELTNAPPGTGGYLLGGDHMGRDIFARLAVGTGQTLLCAAIVLIVSSSIGITSGLIAGYYGGRFEAVASWLADALMSLPGIILLMALYPLIGPNIRLAMAIFGVLISPAFYRLTRAMTLNVRNELYVDAAKIAGLSNARIIGKHVLMAVRGPLLIMSGGLLAAGIGIQAALEYLGLGNPNQASWGLMMQEAFNNMYSSMLPILWPAALMTLTILALVLLGNAIRDAFETSASQLLVLKPATLARIRAERANDPAATSPRPVGAPTETAADLLAVHHLTVAYPTSMDSVRAVVRDVSFGVHKGEVHGIVGESGSGKSQTSFAILGILAPTARILEGEILFDGKDLLGDRGYQRAVRGSRIGYIPQEPMANLDPSFTVGSQLNEGLRAATGLSKDAAKEKLLALLKRVGINDPQRTYDSYPHQVSGGMAQRVLIAGAIAPDPDFLIADEPTTALDVTVQAEVLELLRELQAERNLGMILVTHNFGVVADICDRVSVMKDGQIVESNTTAELFANPQHEYTRMLLGSTLDGVPLREPLALTREAGV